MAEKPKDKKDDKKSKPKHHSGGEMSFGLEVILFVIALFIIWVLVGGPNKDTSSTKDQPFIKGQTPAVLPQ